MSVFAAARGCTLGLALATIPAQSLTTTFNHDNGGAVGGAVYCDLTVLAPTGITLTRLDLNLSSSIGTVGGVEVLTIAGGRAGQLTNPAAWTQVATVAGVGALGPGLPTPVAVTVPLAAGVHGLCVRLQGLAHAYTTGGGAVPTTFGNPDLTLVAGEASHVPFQAPLFSPRILNATLSYVAGVGVLAANQLVGQGCIRRFTSAYEYFPGPALFDLGGTAMRWTPTAGGYQWALAGSWLPPGSISPAVPLVLGDDDQVAVPLAAMGSFPWPTGPSTSLVVCSNGFVSAAAGNGTTFTPAPATMLAAPQSAVWLHHDFDPSVVGSGPIEVMQNSSVTVVTWNNVRNAGGLVPLEDSRFQFQFAASGVITLVCEQMTTFGNEFLVGYSPGGPSADPGSIDLSAVLALGPRTLAANDVEPLSLGATTRPILGTSWSMTTSNVPPSGTVGVAVYGLSDPGIDDLQGFGMPGCGLRASPDLLQPFLVSGAAHTRSLAIPSVLSLLGGNLWSTTAVWASPPPNPFGAITANGLRGTLGNL